MKKSHNIPLTNAYRKRDKIGIFLSEIPKDPANLTTYVLKVSTVELAFTDGQPARSTSQLP